MRLLFKCFVNRMEFSGRLAALFGMLCISFASQAGELRIYAAASLTDAITTLAASYQQIYPQARFKFSFAGSSTLARQIEHGAPADVFIFADRDWADYLQQRNLVDAAHSGDLLTNELVLIAPTNSKVDVDLNSITSLVASFNGKLCTGSPASVPVGKYAQQALTFYGWWDEMQSRLVGAEDVRIALAFVERGECALGIVYKTDALMSKKVRVVARFAEESYAPIVYSSGMTTNATQESVGFWKFLRSELAQDVFADYGFGVIPKH